MPPLEGTERQPAGLPPGLEMQEQLAAIAASVPGLIYSFQLHPDGAVSLPYASAILKEVFGLAPEAVRQDGREVLALVHPEDAARVQAFILESARTMALWQAEFRVRHPQKGEIWVEGRSVPRRLADGSTLWHGFIQDVTERKGAMAALQESERRFREMMQNVRLLAVMLDMQGRVVFANEFLLGLTGWKLAEVLGQDWFARFLPGEIAGRVKAVFVTLAQGQLAPHFENEIVTRSGERRLIAWNNTDLKDPAGRIIGVSSIGQDITEKRAAERALRESAERFRAVVESAPEGIFVQTLGRFAYVNGRAASLFGASAPAALVGQAVLERFHPEDHSAIRERMRLLNQERRAVPSSEERCLRLDGRSFEAEVSAVPFEYEGQGGALVFFRDISERKQLEGQLRQAQKLEAVGRLAGGVAHDFNNILAAILLRLGLLRAEPTPEAGWQQGLGELEEYAQRAARLTRQLLLFGRRSVMEAKSLDLNEVVEPLLRMLNRLLGEHIQVEFEAQRPLPAIRADAGMLEQVLMNLSVNARDAMPQGGRLRIATAVREFAGDLVAAGSERRTGRFVCLSVTDTGCGMDAATRANIFEPFFTTKGVGQGTGLGLATVYSITQQHGGWIEVTSEAGQGSRFEVFFPANEQSESLAGAASAAASSSSVKGGRESILLVEDEQAVRALVRLTLKRLGYRVHEASNATEATRVWCQHQQEIALLFTDMVMPEGTSGWELAALLRQEKPGLKVVIASGYSTEMIQRGAPQEEGIVFLPKPFEVRQLAATVRACLDRSAESRQQN